MIILAVIGWVLFLWLLITGFIRVSEPSGREVAYEIKEHLLGLGAKDSEIVQWIQERYLND